MKIFFEKFGIKKMDYGVGGLNYVFMILNGINFNAYLFMCLESSNMFNFLQWCRNNKIVCISALSMLIPCLYENSI